jgi:amidase
VHYTDPGKRALLKPEVIWEVETGLKLSAYDVTAASVVRSAWYAAARRLFARYDFLVMPTAQVFPFDAGETWPRKIASQKMRTYHEWMKGVCLITMTGSPSLAVPAGFNPQGLPIGIQIVAPVHHEMDCLRLGFAYEQATEWTARRPPLLLA